MTPKQQAFVLEYLIDLNASAAAVRAGYSAKHADVQGSQLLARPEIVEAIDRLKAERSRQTGIDAAWLLKRLVAEAEADLRDLYKDDGSTLKPIGEWPPIWRTGLVQGMRWGKFGLEIRISDRIRRLEMIGKHIGVNAFQENVRVSGLGDLAARLDRARNALADIEDDDMACPAPTRSAAGVSLASRLEAANEAAPATTGVGGRSPAPVSPVREPEPPPSAPARAHERPPAPAPRADYRPLLPRAQTTIPAGYTPAGNDWPDFVQGTDHDPTDGLID